MIPPKRKEKESNDNESITKLFNCYIYIASIPFIYIYSLSFPFTFTSNNVLVLECVQKKREGDSCHLVIKYSDDIVNF